MKLDDSIIDQFNLEPEEDREIHLKKLIALMQNCSVGAIDVSNHLAQICKDRALLDKYVDKNAIFGKREI